MTTNSKRNQILTTVLKCTCRECNCRDVSECSEFPCSCCHLEHATKNNMIRIETKSLMESEYLRFSVIGLKPKTKVFGVFVKDKTVIESGVNPQPILLGKIKYYAPWRQYCYFPVGESVLANSCLIDIHTFIAKLKDGYLQ